MAAHPKSLPLLDKISQRKSRIVVRKPATRIEPIAAAKAKAHFLQLLDEVERERKPITITKRGRIVAQIVPVAEESQVSVLEEIFGRTKGLLTITGDIVSPDHDAWGSKWS